MRRKRQLSIAYSGPTNIIGSSSSMINNVQTILDSDYLNRVLNSLDSYTGCPLGASDFTDFIVFIDFFTDF